ncbi:MAG TPA: VOC family protein [Xanthomonadales bacterium]|nr:VOC family protein [Xanthomonadales bacterium]
MHKSQLAGFIIDCQTEDLDAAASFWGAALGLESKKFKNPEESEYRSLETAPDDYHIEVQRVSHASRVHLDIETDDIKAEVERLEALGARRLGPIKGWVVMEAPTGQRFCVVKAGRANFAESANHWD